MNILKLVLSVLLLYSSSSFAADEIHWTIMGQTAVTFDWRGSSSEDSISYGTKSGEYSKKVTAYTPKPRPYSSSGPFWEAKITGLKENTRYYYSISNGSEATFKTPPPRGSSGYTIVAEGDIGDTGTYFEVGAVQDMVADQKPEFVLVLGDLAYGDQHGDEAVDQHFNDLMVWSRDAAFMPVWGNHEWGDSDDDLRNYKGRFDLPNSQASPNAPSNGCCGEDWFWFDYGNVRYIGVPEPYSRAWSDWQKKAAVLMAEAQSDSDITFIVTMVHRAAYSSGSHSGSLSLKERLDELGDDYSKYALNLNGHSHNYERSHPQHGVVHVTAGGSGSSLGDKGSCLWYTCKQPSWSAYRAMHLGVLKLDISANGIAGTYYCGPASKGENDVHCDIGDVMDKFS
ncbi:MAG: purple acid phosphatase family protein, partial [Methylococcaceae bacterium]